MMPPLGGLMSSITFLMIALFFNSVGAVPERGDVEWTMLLCKYRGNDLLPHDRDWYVRWLTDESIDGSIAYFFHKASNGVYRTGRSQVHGWFELPFTRDEVFDLANRDERIRNAVDTNRRIYVKTKELCYEYATSILRINVPSTRRLITVVNDEDTAVFCLAFGVLVTPRFMITAAVVHEMAHSFNLGHSYSDSNARVFSHAEPGEYDDRYDLMSTANAHMYKSDEYGLVGPGFNGAHLDYLGWLPAYRVYYFGRQDTDRSETSIRLSSLSHEHSRSQDWLMVQIPYDRDDPQLVYTVELRTREDLDAGIPKAVVLIHRVARRENGGFLYSMLLSQKGKDSYDLTAGQQWEVLLDSSRLQSRFVRVRVDWIDEERATAQVTVHSTFAPTACARGEVQRAAFELDLPCVSILEREEAQRQNKRNIVRRDANTGKCLPGFVPRRAGPEDDVCVTEFERDSIQRQNDRWRSYREFYTAPTYGLNSCRRGFLWRQIDPYDYACISEARRDELRRQDEFHETRRQGPASNQCQDGFVWRAALPDDETCVTNSERLQAYGDNEKAVEKYVYQRFFNADNKLQK